MANRDYLVRSALVLCIAWLAVSIDDDQASSDAAIHRVSEITWHPRKFVDQSVRLIGYLLAREDAYVLFSDEPKGRVTVHDLPVTGPGLDQMVPMKKYVIVGRFLDHGLKAANGNDYHLELGAPPSDAAN